MTKSCTVEELRFVSGTSNKFYRAYLVENDASSLAVFQWGRRGTVGQVKVETAPSLRRCSDLVDRQLRKKRMEGYTHEWGPERLDPHSLFPLPSHTAANSYFGAHLATAWRERQRELVSPALAALSSLDPTAADAILVLYRFDMESRSEVVAGELVALLPGLTHALGKHGCAVLLPERAAREVAAKYTYRSEVLPVPAPVDAGFLEVMMGVWDPASTGPLAYPRGALEMASAIV